MALNTAVKGEAYATLVTNPDYAEGALTLARSLAVSGASRPLLVLATPNAGDLGLLEAEGCKIVPVERPALSAAFIERHGRENQHKAAPFTKGTKPAFHDPVDNFCKLQLWMLEDYSRLVFIDADAIVLKNCDKLFGYPEFSAAPNVYEGLSDFGRLNSGVFVAAPSGETYKSMLARLDAPNAFWRRTDQTFLQDYFPDWHGLPYTYNVLQYVFFNLPELWIWDQLHILHFQYEKPWQEENDKKERLKPLIDLWWTVRDGGRPPARLDSPFGSKV